MTVQENITKVTVTGPLAVGDVIPIPFQYINETDIKVEVGGSAYIYNVDYEVTLQNVEIKTPVEESISVTVYRDTPLDQQAEFPQNNKFNSAKMNEALDKVCMIQQEHREELDRCLRVAIDTASQFAGLLPSPSSGKALMWDAEGEIINTPVTMLEIQESVNTAVSNSTTALSKATDALTTADAAVATVSVAAQAANQAAQAADQATQAADQATQAATQAAEQAIQIAENKQDKLISGTTIKTLNDESLLGNGNIVIPIPTKLSDFINDTGYITADDALSSNTKYGANLSLSLDPTTYVLTLQLKDQDGNNLGTAKTVDLPIESLVMDVDFDEETNELIIKLQSGTTTRVPIDSIIGGLQHEINANNKLNADFIEDTSTTKKLVTNAEKSTWNGKQDAISDLATIRTNASNGNSAYTTIQGYGDVVTHDADEFLTEHQDISGKQDKITSTNKLSSDLVDDTNKTHKFVTATEKSTWNSKQDAISDLSTIRTNAIAGAGAASTIAGYGDIVTHDANEFAEASHSHAISDVTNLQTTLNGKQPTIDSSHKLSADLISDGTTNKTVTAAEKSTWNGKQNAISDLSTIRSNATAGANAATTIAGYGDIVTHDADEFLTEHQDLSGYQTKITSSNKLSADLLSEGTTNKLVSASEKSTWNGKQNALVSGTNIKTVNGTSLLGSGNVAVQSVINDLSDIRSNATAGKGASDTISGYGDVVTHDADEFMPADTVIPVVNNATLTIQKNGTAVDTFTANASVDKIINITVPTKASDINALPSSTKYGASLSMSINNTTYVLTAQMKDQDGNNLGTAQTIDLPIESLVMDVDFDEDTNELVIKLQSGTTTRVPIGSIIGGLQSEINADNKLDADFIEDTLTTKKLVTTAEKNTWNSKQNAINDLATIRTNASNGNSAYTTIQSYGDIVTHDADEFLTEHQDLSGYQTKITSSNKLSADLLSEGTTNKLVSATEKSTWNGKQNAITSSNKLSADLLSEGTTNKLVSASEKSTWNGKQNALVSGTNIKTINGNSLLGSGNITIEAGSDITVDSALSTTSTNPVQNKIITTELNKKIEGITSSDVTTALGYTPYNATNPNGYTNNVGTITGIKMNGSSKGTSGVVDLGTVITAHQDISGKQDKITSTNKLSADLLSEGTTNKLVSSTEKTTWNGKQDALSSTQIANIAKGGTAVQPGDLATVATSGSYNDLSNKPTIPTVPPIATSVSASSTNAETVGAKLFYDTVGDIETLLQGV